MINNLSVQGDLLTSKYFGAPGPILTKMIFDIPTIWWNRLNEYEWARHFCQPGDKVLEAACGICHACKFYHTDLFRLVVA